MGCDESFLTSHFWTWTLLRILVFPGKWDYPVPVIIVCISIESWDRDHPLVREWYGDNTNTFTVIRILIPTVSISPAVRVSAYTILITFSLSSVTTR